MKISDIQKQRKEGRYNIYLDGNFAFGLYKETIFNYGLRKNDELTEDKINEIVKYDEITYGKRVAYNYLSYRPRSLKELRSKLKEKGISESSAEEIIEYFIEHKFLDDYQYSKSYIENLKLKKPIGRRSLQQKLSMKGIDKEIIQKVIDENYSEEIELSNGITLLEKYISKHKNIPKEKIKQKSFAYLMSRGFDYGIISEIIKETLNSD